MYGYTFSDSDEEVSDISSDNDSDDEPLQKKREETPPTVCTCWITCNVFSQIGTKVLRHHCFRIVIV